MINDNKVYFAAAGSEFSEKICLNPAMANRHGFICGATGTGKTVTLKVLAESFSSLGVPVFVSDVKGDVSGLSRPGIPGEKMTERLQRFGLNDFTFAGCPCTFFDIFAKRGIPLRTTVTEIGPVLMSRILDLNDTQTDLLTVVYKIADDNELLLIDTKDLKAVLNYAFEHSSDLEMEYGHIAKTTVSAIIRSIVAIESHGGDRFFGEPAIDIKDFLVKDSSGKGMISILDSSSLINDPRLYSAFMLFLMSELFEVLPEVGDQEKPKIVFFFDEAHLIFKNAAPSLIEKITQVIKLIRSKGVGIYFVTQSPGDIPEEILSQLSNKIEHALRAYTPAEIRSLKASADSFRENPAFDTKELLQNLGTGEAIISVLDEKGIPDIARHGFILPPQCSLEGVPDEIRNEMNETSIYKVKYGTMIDRDSAYEFLKRSTKETEVSQNSPDNAAELPEESTEAAVKKTSKESTAVKEVQVSKEELQKKKAMEKAVKSIKSTAGGTIGRELGKSIGKSIGGSFGKTLGGNLGASLGRNLFGTLFKL